MILLALLPDAGSKAACVLLNAYRTCCCGCPQEPTSRPDRGSERSGQRPWKEPTMREILSRRLQAQNRAQRAGSACPGPSGGGRHHQPVTVAAPSQWPLSMGKPFLLQGRGQTKTPAASRRMSQGLAKREGSRASAAGAPVARSDDDRPAPGCCGAWVTPPVANECTMLAHSPCYKSPGNLRISAIIRIATRARWSPMNCRSSLMA